MDALLDQVENDDSVRVIVLHGEGRFFSAGADIKEFTTVTSGEEFSKLAASGQEVFERLERFHKPVIAAIHGAALGGGLELAMGCHMRIVTETAKLGLPELQLGLIPGFAGTQRLPRYVGMPKAAEMLLTSEPITGEEAVQYGLSESSLSGRGTSSKDDGTCKENREEKSSCSESCIRNVAISKPESYYEGVKAEADSFGEVFVSEDAKEGIQAFLEKREPVF